MEKRKLAHLILGSMILPLRAEDFIDATKEMDRFDSRYDFGTPVKQAETVEEKTIKPIEKNETNMTTIRVDTIAAQPVKTIQNDLNITCGAKCGIILKKDNNDS